MVAQNERPEGSDPRSKVLSVTFSPSNFCCFCLDSLVGYPSPNSCVRKVVVVLLSLLLVERNKNLRHRFVVYHERIVINSVLPGWILRIMFSGGVLLTELELELNRAAISQQLLSQHEIDSTVQPCSNPDPNKRVNAVSSGVLGWRVVKHLRSFYP